MTDQQPTPRGNALLDPGKENVQLIYILYLAGFVVGITAIVGIVMAYINRGKSEPWVETHYTWLIRTFWIGLLYSLAAFVLMFVAVGFLLFALIAIWFIVRCVVGMQTLGRNEPIKDPQSWLI
jgi:uncharacterized membrane protein